MKTINRTAITIPPKQPFIDWANSFEDGEKYGADKPHVATILIPDTYDESNFETFLKKNYKQLFDEDFESWMTDPNNWPDIKGYKMFEGWFEIICLDMTWDHGDGEIEHDKF